MSYLWIENGRTGEIEQLNTPFDRDTYFAALDKLGLEYDEDEADVGNVDNMRVVEVSTDTPIPTMLERESNPLLINLAEYFWGAAAQQVVELYMDYIRLNDVEEFCNLCVQSDDMNYYAYENGYGFEGYGREMLMYSGEVPEYLERYIDYEEYGNDYSTGSSDIIGEYGYICGDDTGFDETKYDFADLMNEYPDWDEPISAQQIKSEQPQPVWTPKPMTQDVLFQML